MNYVLKKCSMRLLDLNMESNLKYMKMVCNVLLALLYRILACRVPMMPFNTIKNKLHDIVNDRSIIDNNNNNILYLLN